MNLLQILLPDRICMILREASPAWEQGGVRRIAENDCPNPIFWAGGARQLYVRGPDPSRVSSPRAGLRGQPPTPPAPLALAPLPYSGTGHSHILLVAPGAGQLPFSAAERPRGSSGPGGGAGSTAEAERDAGLTTGASNRPAGTWWRAPSLSVAADYHPAGPQHHAGRALPPDPTGLFPVAQPGAGLSAARGRRASLERYATRLVPAEPGSLCTCLSSLYAVYPADSSKQ